MSTLPESLLDLSLGRVDAVFAGEQSSRYYINKNLSNVEFRTVDAGYGIGYSGIGIRKEDDQLQKVLQEIIDEMISDGAATKVSEEWYGIDKSRLED